MLARHVGVWTSLARVSYLTCPKRVPAMPRLAILFMLLIVVISVTTGCYKEEDGGASPTPDVAEARKNDVEYNSAEGCAKLQVQKTKARGWVQYLEAIGELYEAHFQYAQPSMVFYASSVAHSGSFPTEQTKAWAGNLERMCHLFQRSLIIESREAATP